MNTIIGLWTALQIWFWPRACVHPVWVRGGFILLEVSSHVTPIVELLNLPISREDMMILQFQISSKETMNEWMNENLFLLSNVTFINEKRGYRLVIFLLLIFVEGVDLSKINQLWVKYCLRYWSFYHLLCELILKFYEMDYRSPTALYYSNQKFCFPIQIK